MQSNSGLFVDIRYGHDSIREALRVKFVILPFPKIKYYIGIIINMYTQNKYSRRLLTSPMRPALHD